MRLAGCNLQLLRKPQLLGSTVEIQLLPQSPTQVHLLCGDCPFLPFTSMCSLCSPRAFYRHLWSHTVPAYSQLSAQLPLPVCTCRPHLGWKAASFSSTQRWHSGTTEGGREWMRKITQGPQGVACSSQQEQPLPCQSGGAGSVLSRAAKSSVITALGHNGQLGVRP